jgi:hypothetical protein
MAMETPRALEDEVELSWSERMDKAEIGETRTTPLAANARAYYETIGRVESPGLRPLAIPRRCIGAKRGTQTR